VKIISEPSATRNIMLKVIRSNMEIPVTPPQIARFRSNLLHSNIISHAIHCNCSRSEVKGQGYKVKSKVTAKSNVPAANKAMGSLAT